MGLVHSAQVLSTAQYGCLKKAKWLMALWTMENGTGWCPLPVHSTQHEALVYDKMCWTYQASQVALVVKNPPANAEDIRDMGSIPGSRRSPRRGHGNPLQYSRPENQSRGQRSLVGDSPGTRKESEMTEVT